MRARSGRVVTVGRDRIGGAAAEDSSDDATDEVLVRAAGHGDEAAFARLVRRYLRRAMTVAMEYVESREDAEDVVQDAFRRVADNLAGFDDRRNFSPWFFTILRNAARNQARHQQVRRHDVLGAEHPSTAPGPYDDARRSELRQRIDAAIEALPLMQRTCFRLCMVEDLTSAEAADATGVAESTVRVHVFKARRTLRSLLTAWRDERDEGNEA